MKKPIVAGLLALAIAIQCSNPPAHGNDSKVLRFMNGQKHYLVNDIKTEMDADPYINNGRTFVPVRFLGDGLRAETDYKEGVVTVSKNDKQVTLKIGSPYLEVSGAMARMDVTPEVREGRTYLPARFVAEAFGYKVDWDADSETVRVFPEGVELLPERVAKIKEILPDAEMRVPAQYTPFYAFIFPDSQNHVRYDGVDSESRASVDITISINSNRTDIARGAEVIKLYTNDAEVMSKYFAMFEQGKNNPAKFINWKKHLTDRKVWVNYGSQTQCVHVTFFKKGVQ